MSKQRKKHGRKGERLGSFDKKELEHIGAFSITLSTNADRKVFDIPKLNEHEDKGTDGKKKSSDDRDDVNNLLKRVWFNYFYYANGAKSQQQYYRCIKSLKLESRDVGQWLCNFANVLSPEDRGPQYNITKNLITEWWDVIKKAKLHYEETPEKPFIYERPKKGTRDREKLLLKRLKDDVKEYEPFVGKRKYPTVIRKVDPVDKNDEITQLVVEKCEKKNHCDKDELLEYFEMVKTIIELHDNMRRNALANINYWTKEETVEYDDGKDIRLLVTKNPKKKRRCSENRELKLYPFQAIQSNEYEKRHYPTEKQFLESFIEETRAKISNIPKAKTFDDEYDIEELCEIIIETKKEAHVKSRASWIMECLKKG